MSALLRFREGVSVAVASDDAAADTDAAASAVLTWRARALTLRPVTATMLGLLDTMTRGASDPLALEDTLLDADGADCLAVWHIHLRRLRHACLLRYQVNAAGGDTGAGAAGQETALLSSWPMTKGLEFHPKSWVLPDQRRWRLSRFASLRAENGELLLETPLSDVQSVVHDSRLGSVLSALASAREVAALASLSRLSPASIAAALALLHAAAVVGPVDAAGRLPEDDDPVLRQWQPHDLAFHARGRLGRHDHAFGGTFRFLGEIEPLPAVAVHSDAAEGIDGSVAPLIALPPAREPLCMSLDDAMRRRRSLRRHGEAPMTLEQLGAFLYRVARVKAVIDPEPERRRFYQVSLRPYPSGGATYDLEIYLTVERCDGLAPGLYHYDPLAHGLRLCRDANAATEALLDGARAASRMATRPHILLTLTSRFQRLSWKYETIAYTATLKNVGVLYQTLYLVASAMGLAPCALGGGNSDLFAAAAGTAYYEESSVGEFMLGSRHADDADDADGILMPSGRAQ